MNTVFVCFCTYPWCEYSKYSWLCRILWVCHGVMYKQLSAWLLHGMLIDNHKEFFIHELTNGSNNAGVTSPSDQADGGTDLGIPGVTGKQLAETMVHSTCIITETRSACFLDNCAAHCLSCTWISALHNIGSSDLVYWPIPTAFTEHLLTRLTSITLCLVTTTGLFQNKKKFINQSNAKYKVQLTRY